MKDNNIILVSLNIFILNYNLFALSSNLPLGNHSTTMYPDHNHASIEGKPAVGRFDEEWIKTKFIPKVQKRGGEVLALR